MSVYEEIHPEFVQARHLRNVIKVAVEDITYFKADSRYVVAYHTGGELLLATPLIQLERVYGERFIRAHHSALVSRARLQAFRNPRMRQAVPACVYLHGAARPIVVSRRRVQTIRNAVAEAIASQTLLGGTA